MGQVCFSQVVVITFVGLVMGLLIGYNYYYTKQFAEMTRVKDTLIREMNESISNQTTTQPIISPPAQPIIIQKTEPETDPVTEFDVDTLSNPFIQPRRRPPRHVFNNMWPHRKMYTRGLPDTFSKIGYLIDESSNNNDSAKVIHLFGRQKYPNSNDYEYYGIAMMGDNQVKVEFDKQRKELYDGDKIMVPILNKEYEVKIHKQPDFPVDW